MKVRNIGALQHPKLYHVKLSATRIHNDEASDECCSGAK